MKAISIEPTQKAKIQDATRVAGIQLTIAESSTSSPNDERCQPLEGAFWREAESDQMTFLKPGSRAWAEAWKDLLTLAGCVVARNQETGDRWEYVGTYKGHHEFRHKNHPQTGERLYARVPTSCGAGKAIIWSGTPYHEEGSETDLRKECPLKALFRADDG